MKHVKNFQDFLNEGMWSKSKTMESFPTFTDFINESLSEMLDFNDPVLVAFRASREDRKKAAAAQKDRMKKRVYGKKREKLEDELWSISQDLKDAYAQRRDIYDEMDAEAGEKGADWNDSDANRYGDRLNRVDDEIESLIKKRQAIETKLAY